MHHKLHLICLFLMKLVFLIWKNKVSVLLLLMISLVNC